MHFADIERKPIHIFIFMDFYHRIKFMRFLREYFLMHCILAVPRHSFLSTHTHSPKQTKRQIFNIPTHSFDSVLVIKITCILHTTNRSKLRFRFLCSVSFGFGWSMRNIGPSSDTFSHSPCVDRVACCVNRCDSLLCVVCLSVRSHQSHLIYLLYLKGTLCVILIAFILHERKRTENSSHTDSVC